MYTDAPEAVEIVKRAFPGYSHTRGRLSVEPFQPGIIPTSYWSGGERDYWAFAPILPNAVVPSIQIPENGSGFTAFDRMGGLGVINFLPHGCALVCWSRGNIDRVRIMVPAENISKLIQEPKAILTLDEDVVLACTRCYKAFARREYAARAWGSPYGAITPEIIARWDSAKASLVSKGLLRKDGSITTEGRNQAKADSWLRSREWENEASIAPVA